MDSPMDTLKNSNWVTIHWKINDFFSRKLYKTSEFKFQDISLRLSLELIASKNIDGDSYKICIEHNDETFKHILKLIIRSGFLGESEEKQVLSHVCIPNLDRRQCLWKASRKYLLDNYEKLKTSHEESESLTFYCLLDLEREYVEEESEEPSDLELKNLLSLSDDFGKFLHSTRNAEEESDITFKRGESLYFAHKDIISARCSKFAQKILNNNGNHVEVSDMDSTVIKQFLHYIYTGTFQNLTEEDALQLYTASFTYDFKALRQVCAKFLTLKLSEENVCRRLILANEKNDENFKKDIISFLEKASKYFWESETWLTFCVNRSKLACEVYNAFDHIKMLLKPED